MVERVNKTLAAPLYRRMTDRELKTKRVNRKWIDILNEVVNEYNNRKHSSTNAIPIEVMRNEKRPKLRPVQIGNTKLRLGDVVRLVLDKEERPRASDEKWTRTLHEIYLIDRSKGPIMFGVRDIQTKKPYKRQFYENELQPVQHKK